MHELGIATSILESVEREISARPGAIPRIVGIRIGELSGVDPDALAFSWQAILSGTPHQSLQLNIETVPWTHRCQSCSHEFRVIDYQTQCPRCADTLTCLITGDELVVAYIELDEPELAPATPGGTHDADRG